MVKKAKWLENVKKAWLPDVKKLKDQSVEETEISHPVLVTRSRSSPPQFEVRVDEVNYEPKKKKYLSQPPSDEEEDALEDSSSSSPDSVPPAATPDRSAVKSKEDAAAISIQSTFRGHLARQEAKRMRRLARVKSFMEGSVVQRQAAHTLKSVQAFSHVQSQILSRKIRMSKENQARQKHLLQKHAKEIGGSKNGGGDRNVSNQSKKQVEAGLLNKKEATRKRERAIAYASTHQQDLKSNLKPTNTTMFMDLNNMTWGWSSSERLTDNRTEENSEKEESSTEKPPVKTSTNRKNLNSSTQPNTPSTSSSSTTRKNKPTPPSIRAKTTDEIAKIPEKNRRHIIGRSSVSDDEGFSSSTSRLRNMVPTKLADEIAKSSEKNLRHNIGRSSISDDEGLASSLARRRNMVPTKPPRGKLKGQSSLGIAAASKATKEQNNVEKGVPAKKRASPAPKPRRPSAPPKVDNNVLRAVICENVV